MTFLSTSDNGFCVFRRQRFLLLLLVLTIGLVQAQPPTDKASFPGQLPLDKRQGNAVPALRSGDIIAFAGGANIAAMRKDGILETLLYAAHPTTQLRIWNLGWEGDTVYEQFRDVGFGSWSKNLDSLGANVVFAQFGQMESLEGEKSIPQFIDAYRQLLDSIRKPDRQIVLLSPVPFEPDQLNRTPLGKSENPMSRAPVEKYAEAIKTLAETEGYGYIDLYHPIRTSSSVGSLTNDGLHLNQVGQQVMASLILKTLNLPEHFSQQLTTLQREVLNKNVLWFNYWRPSNWAFLNGDRTTQPFSHDWQDKTRRIFPEEMKAFEPLIRGAEQRIMNEQRKLAPVR
ncbi:SGNH/GDSL hydrolase family protein [Larkinella bovis]|uniref:SGNH/GDSL hydrolase family protein n=1 Tax=Larkinella bovis TaxID=683041 RepID=A0ABW0IH15_9BACT